MATFGNTENTSHNTMYNGICGSLFSFSGGDITSITAYNGSDYVNNVLFRYFIYADNSGIPGSLIAYTDTLYVSDFGPVAFSWREITFTAPVTLPAGNYWLAQAGYNSNANWGDGIIMGGGPTCVVDTNPMGADYVNNIQDPYPSGLVDDAATISIYATYTPTPAPVADFTGTPVYGRAPLSVQFTDTSTNTPTSWTWSFGDGAVSNDQNPVHIFRSGGTPDVSLTATNDAGSDTETKTDYITVLDPANHHFWLGVSPVVPPTADEDFTTYTNNNVSVTASRVTVGGTEPATSYKDFGAGYFNTFTHWFTFKCNYKSGSQSQNGVVLYALSDSPAATNVELNTANKGISIESRYYGSQGIILRNYNGDASDVTSDAQLVGTDIVYVTVIKDATTVTVNLYSDSARTVLEDSISVACTDTFRYYSAYGIEAASNYYWTGYIENTNLHK